jgi:2-polyprenyl-3-methyl-5-hydroxy-6-metoxy-1,4-benzoquinol methylase
MTSDLTQPLTFGWLNAEHVGSHSYLLPKLKEILTRRVKDSTKARLLDIGCGNGSITNVLGSLGFRATGIDPSSDGIAQCRSAYPSLDVHLASVYEDLQARFGTFDVIVCLEVVEHLYSPHVLASNAKRLLDSDGFLVLSTPYHGYWKNLALSLANKWDFHHHPLVEHGHIKFWAKPTLERLFAREGFVLKEFYRLGRIPPLANSMMLVFAMN